MPQSYICLNVCCPFIITKNFQAVLSNIWLPAHQNFCCESRYIMHSVRENCWLIQLSLFHTRIVLESNGWAGGIICMVVDHNCGDDLVAMQLNVFTALAVFVIITGWMDGNKIHIELDQWFYSRATYIYIGLPVSICLLRSDTTLSPSSHALFTKLCRQISSFKVSQMFHRWLVWIAMLSAAMRAMKIEQRWKGDEPFYHWTDEPRSVGLKTLSVP